MTPVWIRSIVYALSVYSSSSLVGENWTVSATADTGASGTFRWAIEQLNHAGTGTILFDPSIQGATVTLLRSLPKLGDVEGMIGNATGPFLRIDGSGVLTAFTIQGGTISINNLSFIGVMTIDSGASLIFGPSASFPLGCRLINEGQLVLSGPSGTLSAHMMGSGSVEVLSGTLFFNGSNAYGGTTTIGNGATLTILSPSAFPQLSPIVDNGALIVSLPVGATTSASQPVSGSGTVHVEQGTLTLTGLNVYEGFTRIGPNGILQIGASSALPAHGSVSNFGTLSFQNEEGIALPGVISGSGKVVMDGFQGAVQLTGTNTYAGGTQLKKGTIQIATPTALGTGPIRFEGGTLELLSSFTGSFAATTTVAAGGTLTLDGVTAAYMGLVQGEGPLYCKGNGSLSFEGSNTYTGPLTIGPDILFEVNTDQALASEVITNDGQLVFNVPSATVTAQITGRGSVSLNGPGDFSVIQSSNTYTGGTIISEGILSVNDPNAINSGPLVVKREGSVEPLVSCSTPVIVGEGGGSLSPARGVTFTIQGQMTSPSNAPLSILGEGSVVMSADSTSTALLTLGDDVLGGKLVMQSAGCAGPVKVSRGALLQGSGSTQDLTNTGSIVLYPPLPPGTDTLTVWGDYTQAANAVMQVAIDGPGYATQIQVAQAADLDGTLIVTASPQGAYAYGETYRILIAGEDLSTSFSRVELPSIPRLAIFYDIDPGLKLVVTAQSVLEGAQVVGYNPQQVRSNVDHIVHIPRSDFITVLSSLKELDTSVLSAALDQLHPAPLGAFALVNMNTNERITSLLTGGRCCQEGSIAPFAYFYDQKRVGEQCGFRAQAVGLVASLHFCVQKCYLLGLGSAYSSSAVQWREGRGSGRMDKVSLGLYTQYSSPSASLEGSVIGGCDVFKVTRSLSFTTIDRSAVHERGGYDVTAHVGGSKNLALGRFDISPFFKVMYSYLYQKGFTERGAQSLDLTVRGSHSQMLRSECGLKGSSSWRMGREGDFTATMHLSGVHSCFLVKRHYSAHFFQQEPSYQVRTWSHPLYLIVPGLDLDFYWGSGLHFSVQASVELNSQMLTQKYAGRLGWCF